MTTQRPTDEQVREDAAFMARWRQRANTPEGRAWLDAVRETKQVWGLPLAEAADIVDSLLAEGDYRQATQYVRQQMPQWQRTAEQQADVVCNAIQLGWLTEPTLRRLAQAIVDHCQRTLAAAGEEEHQ